MSFLWGGGSQKTDRGQQLQGWQDLSNIFGFANQQGQADLTKASDFFSSILGGDRAKIGQTLAPEISTLQSQNQQKLNTSSEFGNRSGGTNAGNQANENSLQSSISGMIDSLLGASATGLAGIGSTELGAAGSAAGTLSGQAGQANQQQQGQNAQMGQSFGELFALLAGI